MRPSLRLLDSRVHKPLIHFVGRRQWPSHPETPHPHPFAPSELKERFSDFLKKFQSSSSFSPAASGDAGAASSTGSSGGNVQVYEEFWKAPARLLESHIDEAEMEAIESGGASML